MNLTKVTYRQWKCCGLAFAVGFLYGCKVGWIMVNIQIFLSDSSPIEATKSDISWMTSIAFTSSIFAVLLCFQIGDRFSYRQILTCIVTFYLAVWILILLSSSTIKMMIFYFWMYGIASSMQYIIMCAYIGEKTDPQNRAVLGLIIYLAGGIGTEIGYLISYLNSYYLLALFPLLIAIISLSISTWMIDSSYFLVSQGKGDKALKHLAYSTDKHKQQCLIDLKDMKEYVDEHRNVWTEGNDVELIFMPANLKLVLTMIIANGLSNICGFKLASLTGSLLLKDFKNSVNGYYFTNIFNILNILMSFCSYYTVKKFDRRILLLIGYPTVGLLHFICSLCYYVESDSGNEITWHAQVIAFSILSFLIVSSQIYYKYIALGILKLEIFPHKLKAFYWSLLLCTSDWFIFALNRLYFSLEPAVGNAFLMMVYGMVLFVNGAIIYFLIGDTKNKIHTASNPDSYRRKIS